MFKWPCKTV
jgi:hypothetical protein